MNKCAVSGLLEPCALKGASTVLKGEGCSDVSLLPGIKVGGKWHYLYRAMGRDGNLVNCMLSTTRDMAAAKQFFQQATEVTGCTPERVTTDGHDAYPRAIRQVLGHKVEHRTNRYLNNRLEQDHRGVKPPACFRAARFPKFFVSATTAIRQSCCAYPRHITPP